jgi:hypothetical protein
MSGRAYSKGDGRFYSTLCRTRFDASLPPYDRDRPHYSLQPSGEGFRIECTRLSQAIRQQRIALL